MTGSRPPARRAANTEHARLAEHSDRQQSTARLRQAEAAEPKIAFDSDSLPRLEVPRFASGLLPILVQGQNQVGPYRLLCELASGGMAAVYLGIRQGVFGFEKFVAVKCIHAHLIHDDQFWEMFVDEARIAASVNHPYVCSVFDFGRAGSGYYMAMEFLQGEPLSRFLALALSNAHVLDEPRYPRLISRVIANLAEGLHAIHSIRDESGHELAVVHRDVSPQNLFVLYDGTVRVTDLGIAYARKRIHHTPRQAIKGKVAYLAPEVLEREPFDRRADVWSLGVVLWELLTGRRLFRSASEGETVMAVMSRTVQPPSSFNAHVPKQLDEIVMTALERDPSRRYKTARDMSRALEHFLSAARDTVPAMDVAAWVHEAFPNGLEESQHLIEVAREAALALPETKAPFSGNDTAAQKPDLTTTSIEIPRSAKHLNLRTSEAAPNVISAWRLFAIASVVFCVMTILTFGLVRLLLG